MSRRWAWPAEAAALCVLLAAEGLLFGRNLHAVTDYDEGVYLASMDALRHGQTLGSEVFASQPPGLYLLLRLIGLFSGYSVADARIGFLLVALAGCAGAYVVGRALAGMAGGIAASALLAILPPFPSDAMRVEADVPSVSLALVALALAAYGFRRRAPLVLSALAGAMLVAAVSVKLFALLAVVPLAGLAIRERASRRTLLAAVAGAGAATAAFLIVYAGVLRPLWNDVVQFHRDARAFPSPEPNSQVLRHFLEFRTPSAWLLVLGAVASVVAWRKVWPLWAWVPVVVAFLLWQRPLFDHHLVLLCAALALPAGIALGTAVEALHGRTGLTAGAALFGALAIGFAQQAHRIELSALPESPEIAWATQHLRACTGPVASDQPIAAFRARRVLPGQLVDTSHVRLSTLSPAEVLRLLDENRVQAVFAGRSFLDEPEILAGLRHRFGTPKTLGNTSFYASGGAC